MPALTPGQLLACRFTLVRRVGRGGMAEIWRVRDEELGQELVAKVVPLDAGEERVALLRRECNNARRLNHPHIVRVFDFHRDREVAFITMEAVDGGDIGVLRGAELDRVLGAIVSIADALIHAHGSGVVHRDLKIGNVLWDAAAGPRLLDFGIADLLDGAGDGLRLRGGGSPLAASPEQLAGEPAGPADDVYALGKLIVELVSGRPARDAEDARRLLDAPGVPAPLRELVARMLAPRGRDRAGDLMRIRAELATIHATLDPPATAANEVTLVPPPRAASIRPAAIPVREVGRPRRPARDPRRAVWVAVSIAVPVALAAGVFLFLPRWSAEFRERAALPAAERSAATPSADPAPAAPGAGAGDDADARRRAGLRLRVAELAGQGRELLERLDARGGELWGGTLYAEARSSLELGAASAAAEDYDRAAIELGMAIERLESVEALAADALEGAIVEGRRALEAGDSSAAEAAFRLAARIRPGDERARQGLARAAVVDAVVEQLVAGREDELEGELERAEEHYARAVELDPYTTAAATGLARVRERIADEAFSAAISRGLAALEDGDYAASREALDRAARMRPGSPEVVEALNQARQAVKLDSISRERVRAEGSEREERWRDAADRYESVLALDPTIAFAQNGRERCRMRADLEQRMEFHLSHPGRLSVDTVLEEAASLLDEAREVDPAGPLHLASVGRLERLIERASAPVEVVLESDAATEVTVYRVGRLGRFDRRTLSLRPGRYTVVGSRQGYRDVRHELVVVAGETPEPLVVRCEEAI